MRAMARHRRGARACLTAPRAPPTSHLVFVGRCKEDGFDKEAALLGSGPLVNFRGSRFSLALIHELPRRGLLGNWASVVRGS